MLLFCNELSHIWLICRVAPQTRKRYLEIKIEILTPLDVFSTNSPQEILKTGFGSSLLHFYIQDGSAYSTVSPVISK